MLWKKCAIPSLSIFSAALCTFWVAAAAASSIGGPSCATLFTSSSHEVSTLFTLAPMRAMSPGTGSIESRMPGLIHSLVEMRATVIAADERFLEFQDRSRLRKDLESAGRKLAALRSRLTQDAVFSDAVASVERRIAKLSHVIGGPAKRTMIEAELFHVESQIWEVAVAGVFGGSKIFLNKRLSDLYPDEFRRFRPEDRLRMDREIDIAILREDGSWEWVEVKDWSLESAMRRGSKVQLFKQSLGQFLASQDLGKPKIKLTLVMKYALPKDVSEEYRARSKFDQIAFIFPDATAKQRSQLDLPPRNLRFLREKQRSRDEVSFSP